LLTNGMAERVPLRAPETKPLLGRETKRGHG
jgi:hypothetical protein